MRMSEQDYTRRSFLKTIGLDSGIDNLNREAIFWHFPHYRGKIVPYSIVRAGDWKLIKRYEGKTFELFNLKDDLSEKMPEKVGELDAKLSKWLQTSNTRLPRPTPMPS